MDSQKHICCNKTPVQSTKVTKRSMAVQRTNTDCIGRYMSHHINHSLVPSYYLLILQQLVCLLGGNGRLAFFGKKCWGMGGNSPY